MKEGKRGIVVLSGAIVIVLLLRGFLFTSFVIPSSGMENALLQGDRILVNRWSYGLRMPCISLFSYHRWHMRGAQAGDIAVFNNPASAEPVIDRRNVYIGRCIGAPGDTLLMDSLFMIQADLERAGPDRKKLYSYPQACHARMDSLLQLLSIDHNELMGQNDTIQVRSFSRYEYYLLEQALGDNNWIESLPAQRGEEVQELVVPGKGEKIAIHPGNITLMRNTILLHEGKNVYVRNDSLFVEGAYTSSFVFSQDYYWMASNNSLSLSDSRLFGLVPHNHLIGRASVVWFSKESRTGLFDGYRWERFFTLIR